ncbi:TPA: hypothetical protein J5F79_003844 [Escherichia coli]|nr:hypothetical protein [Escherichia coli]
MNKLLLSVGLCCLGLSTALSVQAATSATATVELRNPATLSIVASTTGQKMSKVLAADTTLFGFTVSADMAVGAGDLYIKPTDEHLKGGSLYANNGKNEQSIQLKSVRNQDWISALTPDNKPSWVYGADLGPNVNTSEITFANMNAGAYPAGMHHLTMEVFLNTN